MSNKNEQHLLDLPDKKGRVDLKQEVEDKFPDNLQKIITARRLRDFLYMLINSVINWTNDNVDLRAYEDETLVVGTVGQTVFSLQKTPVNPEKDAVLSIDGVKQNYGSDFTISGSQLTFIPHVDWVLKPSHKVVLKYRYYLDNMGTGGGSGGGGNPPSAFTPVEVAINNVATMTVTHNLGRLPVGVMVYDVNGFAVVCGVQASSSILTLDFNQPFVGKVLFI